LIRNQYNILTGTVSIAIIIVFLTRRNAKNDNHLLQHYTVCNEIFQGKSNKLAQNFISQGLFKKSAYGIKKSISKNIKTQSNCLRC
jgi:hypothetical protein